jgi:hypothetical protein
MGFIGLAYTKSKMMMQSSKYEPKPTEARCLEACFQQRIRRKRGRQAAKRAMAQAEKPGRSGHFRARLARSAP